MVLLKSLGIIDLILGFCMILLVWGVEFSTAIYLIFGLILLIKAGLGLFKDFGSWVDIYCGLLFLIAIGINIHIFFLIIGAVLLIQKGFISFL